MMWSADSGRLFFLTQTGGADFITTWRPTDARTRDLRYHPPTYGAPVAMDGLAT